MDSFITGRCWCAIEQSPTPAAESVGGKGRSNTSTYTEEEEEGWVAGRDGGKGIMKGTEEGGTEASF